MPPRSVPLAANNFGKDEREAVIGVLDSGQLTQGPQVAAFEEAMAKYLGLGAKQATAMVNSGSSANLLGAALWAHQAEAFHDKRREVVMPALTWSTTVAPFIQHGFKPVFVDVGHDYCLDPRALRDAVGPETFGIVPVHLLGNVCDMDVVGDVAREHHLAVHEDCCEALGAKWRTSHVGSLGHTASYSFYFSHHISTGEGGMFVYPKQWHEVTAFREHGWIRRYPEPQKDAIADHYPSLNPTWTFDELGYNVRSTDIAAAIGLVQLQKAGAWHVLREVAAHQLDKLVKGSCFQARRVREGTTPNPFYYALQLKPEYAANGAKSVAEHLAANGIESRPVLTGNITRHPWYQRHKKAYRVAGSLQRTDAAHDAAVLVPCGPHVGPLDVAAIGDAIQSYHPKVEAVA